MSSSNSNSFFDYDASIVPCVVFIAAFTILLVLQIVDFILYKRTFNKEFKFLQVVDQRDISNFDFKLESEMKQASRTITFSLIPIGLGMLFEVAGYAVRIVVINSTERKLGIYILMEFFTLLAPSIISAGIFMMFNRVEKFLHAEHYSLIPTRILTVFFVIGDVVSFLVQAGGGGLMTREGGRNTGFILGIAGFGMQIFFFMLFVVVAIRFLILIERNPTKISLSVDSNELNSKFFKWKKFAILLVVSMSLIIVRCILRIAGFAEGQDGGVLTNSQAAYYLVDPLPIFLSCALLVWLRPEYRLWDLKSYQIWNEKFNQDSGEYTFPDSGSILKSDDNCFNKRVNAV
jgi:hypothetical protein